MLLTYLVQKTLHNIEDEHMRLIGQFGSQMAGHGKTHSTKANEADVLCSNTTHVGGFQVVCDPLLVTMWFDSRPRMNRCSSISQLLTSVPVYCDL